jgi:hypothetical protein
MLQKKVSLIVGIITLLVVGGYFLQTALAQTDADILGIFQGITPCSGKTPAMPQIPADSDCEQLIWEITLRQDPKTGAPTTYELHSAYGLPQQNTNGLVNGGTPVDLKGKWEILQGTKTNTDAVVYALNPDDPKSAIYFAKMDDNVLHVLAQDGRMLVGNGGWSYSLSRTDSHIEIAPADSAANPVVKEESLSLEANGSSIWGVFDGRTSCADIVVEFTNLPPDPSCFKIKWRLALYQDPKTGQPTTYQFCGTQTSREGTWSITRGTNADPNGIVFRLNLDDSGRFIAFLNADDNNLFVLDSNFNLMVGDELWSYTLSRVEAECRVKS